MAELGETRGSVAAELQCQCAASQGLIKFSLVLPPASWESGGVDLKGPPRTSNEHLRIETDLGEKVLCRVVQTGP